MIVTAIRVCILALFVRYEKFLLQISKAESWKWEVPFWKQFGISWMTASPLSDGKVWFLWTFAHSCMYVVTVDSAHSLHSQQHTPYTHSKTGWWRLLILMAISGSLPYSCAWLGGALGVVGVHLCVYCLPYLIVDLNDQQTKLEWILFSWYPNTVRYNLCCFSIPSHCTVIEPHILWTTSWHHLRLPLVWVR